MKTREVTKDGEKRRHVSEAVRFLVNRSFEVEKKDPMPVVYQQNCFRAAIEIIKHFKLSKSTIDWMAKRLIEKHSGSFIFLVNNYVYALVSLGASKSVIEQYLKELIKAGYTSHASRVANKYLKRKLTKDEMRQLIDVAEKSASSSSTEEYDLIKTAKENGHDDLEQEIKDAIESKSKRFLQDDY